MAVSAKLKAFLDGAKVKYAVAKHPVAYTAQEIAAALHVPGRRLAKSVLVKTDRGPFLAVLSAVHLIDLKKLKVVLGAKKLSIGKESDIRQHFPDVEVGAMSPFGNLYQVPVVVDKELGQAEQIAFNAGSHTDTVTVKYADFAALVTPKTGAFALVLKAKKGAAKPKQPAGSKKSAKNAKRSTAKKKPSTRRR